MRFADGIKRYSAVFIFVIAKTFETLDFRTFVLYNVLYGSGNFM